MEFEHLNVTKIEFFERYFGNEDNCNERQVKKKKQGERERAFPMKTNN
jgi:hypothetical protein